MALHLLRSSADVGRLFDQLYQYGSVMVADDIPIRGRTAREIADSVERAVDASILGPADALPSVRGLATRLGVSPSTVAAAYRELRTRGLVTTEAGRVTRIGLRRPRRVGLATPVSPDVRNLSDGNPDPGLLPPLRTVLTKSDLPRYLYGTPAVLPELAAIACEHFADLPTAVESEQVDIVGGAMDGIERVLTSCARPNDRILVEDPGYPDILDLVPALGMVPVPVAVDDEGPVVDSLAHALASRATAFVVTPRAQNPTGAALSESRARAVRALLADHPDLLIIEDDHASAIADVPYRSLCEDRQNWAVVRTTSKYLGPDLRVGFLAADERTIRRMGDGTAADGVSHLLQHLVIQLWRDDTVRSGMREVTQIYSERRQALLDQLAVRRITAHGSSGLNVVVPVPREVPVVQGLYERGWAVRAGEAHRIESAPFIRVTTSTLHPEECGRFAADLADTLRPGSVRNLA